MRRPGPYQIQAAVAALHANAPTAAATDWPQIAALYGALVRYTPTAVVQLNAAVAMAMAGNLAGGLDWINRLANSDELRDYHLLPAARRRLCSARAGRFADRPPSTAGPWSWSSRRPRRIYLERRLGEVSG